jgi:hypothetical protein
VGPQPANVGLWPIANRTHPESEAEGEEEEDKGEQGADEEEGEAIGAPSGPVMAPPSIAPPVVAPSVPTIPTAQTAAQSTIPTPTVAPTPVATASSSVPMAQPTTGGVSTITTTGAQLPRERPPSTEERQPKRVATEAAASLRGPQLAVGGGLLKISTSPYPPRLSLRKDSLGG